jgi:hypothetical protein
MAAEKPPAGERVGDCCAVDPVPLPAIGYEFARPPASAWIAACQDVPQSR